MEGQGEIALMPGSGGASKEISKLFQLRICHKSAESVPFVQCSLEIKFSMLAK